MADSVNPASLPDGFDVYGCYDDGAYNNAAAVKARFPGKTVLVFTVFPQDNEGDCLDVEQGDASPTDAPGWIVRRRSAGHGGPLVYCSESLLPTVKQCFVSAGVAEPGYIVAAYPGEGPVIPNEPNVVGHQWIDHGPYDESVIADYLPGIDPSVQIPSGPQMLAAGQQLTEGQAIVNGQYWTVLQSDGNLVTYRGSTAIWNAKISHGPLHPAPFTAQMQRDGNFVVYDAASHWVWQSGTSGSQAWVSQNGDGNLVVYVPTPVAKWQSGA